MTESLTTMNMLQICALKQVKKLILNVDNNLYHAQRRQCKIKNILIHTSDTALTTLCMNFHVYRALRKQHESPVFTVKQHTKLATETLIDIFLRKLFHEDNLYNVKL